MVVKVLLSKPIMATVSFKADDNLKKILDTLAKKKGINTSAYIKLVLKKGVDDDLAEITKNGLTVAEEMEILAADTDSKVHGPYKTAKSAINALKK